MRIFLTWVTKLNVECHSIKTITEKKMIKEITPTANNCCGIDITPWVIVSYFPYIFQNFFTSNALFLQKMKILIKQNPKIICQEVWYIKSLKIYIPLLGIYSQKIIREADNE